MAVDGLGGEWLEGGKRGSYLSRKGTLEYGLRTLCTLRLKAISAVKVQYYLESDKPESASVVR